MNKTLLILGGSSGIGFECANYLKSIGYNILIASRNKPNNSDLSHIFVDINDEVSIKKLFIYIEELNLNLYGIIYSIGITKEKTSIENFDINDFNKIISTNVTGLLLSLKYAHRFLKASEGRVVVINSLAARTYSKISGIEYTISKTALSGLVRQLSIEWAKDNILVNSIYPSMVKTKMLENALTKDEIQELTSNIPLGRLVTAIEIAKSVAFLLDQDISFMTGSRIDINGGLYLNG